MFLKFSLGYSNSIQDKMKTTRLEKYLEGRIDKTWLTGCGRLERGRS